MLYITNNFSLNMLAQRAPLIRFEVMQLTPQEASELVPTAMAETSVVTSMGNDVIADAFMDQMEALGITPPEPERLRIKCGENDRLLWLIYAGPKIINGSLPEGGRLEYYILRVV